MEDAAEVVSNLIGYAHQYDKRRPGGGLRGFLEEAALVSDVDGWNSAASAVPFMTLHSAKGLEFDVVFITGLEDDLLPHRRATDEAGIRGEGEAVEEERRLLHVGMTRARKQVFLTYCRARFAQGQERTAFPSRFLEELPADCVERHVGRFASPQERSPADFARDMGLVLEAKRRIKPGQETGRYGELEPGSRVNHPRFGEGEIL